MRVTFLPNYIGFRCGRITEVALLRPRVMMLTLRSVNVPYICAMIHSRFVPAALQIEAGARVFSIVGLNLARYGLVAILLLIGGLKFTSGEAMAIHPLVAHSPFLFWLYGLADAGTVSHLIGASEIFTALLIATRAVSALASGIGSILASATFLVTVSFLFSTPGVWDPSFPALSATGSFLIKDLVLLGASSFTAGEALSAAYRAPQA